MLYHVRATVRTLWARRDLLGVVVTLLGLPVYVARCLRQPKCVFVLRTQDGERVTIVGRPSVLDRYIDALGATEIVGYPLA